VDTEIGELQERRLQHREEAEKFYRDLAAQGMREREKVEALFAELKKIGLRRLRLRRLKFVREQFFLAAVPRTSSG
jgi:hypothetical protein